MIIHGIEFGDDADLFSAALVNLETAFGLLRKLLPDIEVVDLTDDGDWFLIGVKDLSTPITAGEADLIRRLNETTN